MAKKDIEEEDFDDEEDLEDDAPTRSKAGSTRRKSTTKRTYNKRKKVELKDETRHSIWGIVFFVIAIFILLSIFHIGGIAGDFFMGMFFSFLGIGYYIAPIVLGVIGVSFMRKGRPEVANIHAIFGASVLLSILGIGDITMNGAGASTDISIGGYLGGIIAWPFVKLFGTYASILLLGTWLVVSLIILFDERPNLMEIWRKIFSFLKRDIRIESDSDVPEDYSDQDEEEAPKEKKLKPQKEEYSETAEEQELIEKPLLKSKKFVSKEYTAPPLSLLEKDKGKANVGDVKANMNIIQKTLLNFGIPVEMDEVTIGPTVTRYALKPAQGVKLSRILGLQNDLSLALAAHPIRIEAPIPGKSLVGIEIPNKSKSTVGMGTLLSDEKFQNSPKPLMVALGRGLSGKALFGNLAKMPHALIAGTTGSGKSVTIHSIITSLLYRNGPEDMRFIMVDPKRVELTLYNKIPHLLTPVITDPKKTILALKWAAKEMDRRYDVLESHSVRDIESFHTTILTKDKTGEMEKMPYIVIIIDELADIMQTYPRELEAGIVRLAQMSRAVGIHLILSTQRPSVNVITGLIKANVPTRVALQVSSQIDSRTILDQGGAEKLLGAGDMLYMSGEMSQPERLQSAFISEDEVKSVVQYLKDAYMDELPNTIELSGSIEGGNNLFNGSLTDDDNGDDLYEDARQIVIETGKASTSFLQRKLGVGYARAAKLIDMLEERGVVGPGNGAKPRDVFEKSVDNIEPGI
ncbi:MAG: DNA translocase FtsK 4TM domain-containing protein [Candidatus Nomurabacteria bacterium]|nr:DNA translocase FtsK 4TM domain-containing protein [Candidatus Nomurabacteria bacterium]